MNLTLAIAAGGALGALARYALSSYVTHWWGADFPWGILIVNILGCFAMGMIAEVSAQSWNLTAEIRAFLTTGILGGFTTFSAFTLDVAVLSERGDLMSAFLYIAVSVVGSLAALFLGLHLVRVLSL